MSTVVRAFLDNADLVMILFSFFAGLFAIFREIKRLEDKLDDRFDKLSKRIDFMMENRLEMMLEIKDIKIGLFMVEHKMREKEDGEQRKQQ